MTPAQPALFVPHGAPTFALAPGAAGTALAAVAARLPPPRAVVVVSPHWDTEVPTVGCSPALETIHDYGGFPAALYDIRYSAGSDPDLADTVAQQLRQAGFQVRMDLRRGLDHGAWIPLRFMFPAGGIPMIPLSIQGRQGPQHHFRLGQALAPLAAAGMLVLASGNITHNLGDFRTAARSGGTPAYVRGFADWVWERLAGGDSAALLAYRELAPDAARAHPSEDHFLPLFVALGAAGPAYRAERIHAGVDDLVLAMDAYALWPASGGLGHHEPEHGHQGEKGNESQGRP